MLQVQKRVRYFCFTFIMAIFFILQPYELTFTAVTEDELSPNYMSQDIDLLSDAP